MLDKVRYSNLETNLNPNLFFPNKEADGRDRVKQFKYWRNWWHLLSLKSSYIHKAIMASIGLSVAFDVMNVDLLLKRITIIGLPRDLIDLVSIWLKERSFFVTINGENSTLYVEITWQISYKNNQIK